MMKKKLSSRSQLTGFLCLVVLFASLPLMAQEAPSMVRVVTVHTHLGHGQDFEAGMKKMSMLASKHGNRDLAFVGMSTSSPGSYDLVFPMANWNDIAEQEKRGNAMFTEMGEEMAATMMKTAKSVDSAVYVWRGDLSYQPEKPRVADSKAGFTRSVTLRPHLAQGQAFEEVIKKASALRKKHGLMDAVGVWQQVLGADGPAFVVLIDAENEADFYAHQAKAMEKMGSDWQQLMQESSAMLRDIEYGSSVPRPDLMAGAE